MNAADAVELGPEDGTLRLRTYRKGAAARVGHDLLIDVSRWAATVTVDREAPERSSVRVVVETASLQVLTGSGGILPLSGRDKTEIGRTAAKVLDAGRYPEIGFTSTGVRLDGCELTVDGKLSIKGEARPLTIQLQLTGGRLIGTAQVVQSTWGIKPYSAMLGALRLQDAVEVDIDVVLDLDGRTAD